MTARPDPARLAELLATLGWSQRQLAERLSIPSKTTIRQWADGRVRIPATVLPWLERLAKPVAREPVPPGWR